IVMAVGLSFVIADVAVAEPASVHAIGKRDSDQALGAEVGIAAGGDATPGGLRVAGRYLYQLSANDWFDGIASFTYGGHTAGCNSDAMEPVMCTHGATSGSSFEI